MTFVPSGGDQKRKHLGRKYELGPGPAGHWEKAMVTGRQGSRLDGDIDTRIKTTSNAVGRRGVLLAAGAAGGVAQHLPSSTHTCQPRLTATENRNHHFHPTDEPSSWSRQDEIFAPRQELNQVCLSFGDLSIPARVDSFQDQFSRTDSPRPMALGLGPSWRARSLLFTAFLTLLVIVPRDLLPTSLVFSFQR